jgi:hypothetical protein
MYGLLFIVESSELFPGEFLRDRKRDFPVNYLHAKSMAYSHRLCQSFDVQAAGQVKPGPAFIDVKLVVCSQES